MTPRRRARGARALIAALMSAGLIMLPSVTAIGPTAQAAVFGANSAGTVVAPHAVDAPSSTPCVVSVDADQCESTNPNLTIDITDTGDTSGCTFTFSINWGDGSPAQQATANGEPQSGARPCASRPTREHRTSPPRGDDAPHFRHQL